MSYPFAIRSAIGAAGSVNPFANSPVEVMRDPVNIDIYANGDIAGMTLGINGYAGSEPGVAFIPPGTSIGVASTVGKIKINEDFVGTIQVPAGTKLVGLVSNPGAASNFNLQAIVH